jgi:MOSC domain-containing protein YiiM
MQTIKSLTQKFPKSGKLIWIGLRAARNQAMIQVDEVVADKNRGLIGDRYSGRSGKRHVTLLQQEHLSVIASLADKQVSAEMLRRNLLVSGINLLALKGQYFSIGETVFLATGFCHPCSKMEKILGTGGYNVMRGHGGLTAQIITSGNLKINDSVIALADFNAGD